MARPDFGLNCRGPQGPLREYCSVPYSAFYRSPVHMPGWGVGEPIDSFECVDCDWTWQKHGALNSLQLRRKHGMSDKDIMKAGLGLGGFTERHTEAGVETVDGRKQQPQILPTGQSHLLRRERRKVGLLLGKNCVLAKSTLL